MTAKEAINRGIAHLKQTGSTLNESIFKLIRLEQTEKRLDCILTARHRRYEDLFVRMHTMAIRQGASKNFQRWFDKRR